MGDPTAVNYIGNQPLHFHQMIMGNVFKAQDMFPGHKKDPW